jgi:U5 small nuclear ribonucleoprotein component
MTTYPGDYRIFNEQRLCINVVKLFNNEVDGSFIAFGRVMSGTLHEGQDVKVLGENYTQEEVEDMYVAKAEKLWILQAGGRFRIQVS